MGLGYRTFSVSRYKSFRTHSIAQLAVFINRVQTAVGVKFSQIDRKCRVSGVFVIFYGT